jgi:hypothetical protein
MTFQMFLIMPSMSRWKLVGQLRRIMGEVIHWYCPWPGIVNTVSGWDFSSSCICQKPNVRSSIEKIVEFEQPMSPMHSVISFKEYLSMCEWLFNSRTSCTTQSPWPYFLGTQKIGELHNEFSHFTTHSLSHSSRDCSINVWWASRILNCFLCTGLWSLRWILCL